MKFVVIFCIGAATLVLNASALAQNSSKIEVTGQYKFLGEKTRYKSSCDCNCISRYYLSQNPGSWEDSRDDCIRNFKPTSNLVAIETQEELDTVYEVLDSGTAASAFWVNARQGRGEKVEWEWEKTKTEFDPTWIKWDEGEPVLDSGRLNRVQLIVKDDIYFRMKLNSILATAICEIQICS